MSILKRLASSLDRRDEVPNQQLARELAARKDKAGIHEIAENLWNKNKNIQADCIKVLYEVGYIEPKLIAGYAEDFVKLVAGPRKRLSTQRGFYRLCMWVTELNSSKSLRSEWKIYLALAYPV